MANQRLRILLVDLGADRSEINEPIALGSLTSYLKKYLGDRIEIRQVFVQLSGNPSVEDMAWSNIVGLSTRLHSLERTLSVVSDFRKIPEPIRPVLVLGDLIATFASEQLVEMVPEGICVLGEGEEPLLGMAQTYIEAEGNKEKWRHLLLTKDVPNLVFCYGDEIRHTQRRLLPLNTAPAPDRTFVPELIDIGGVIRAEASRGCAWGLCTFCAVQFKYTNRISWRPIPDERIVQELEELSSLGVRSPFYTDEDFIGNDPSRAIKLAEAICEAREQGRIRPDLTLYVDARVDTLLAPSRKGGPSAEDVLRALKKAGLREVFVGIESGAREQVKRYAKPATAKRNMLAVQTLKKLGISLDLGFIMFDPEMELNELSLNIKFIEDAGLKYHDARFNKCLRVEPGTPLVQEYFDKDLIIGPLDINDLTYPYRWLDPRVESVYHAFWEKWEKPYMDVTYELQGKTRGELPGEDVRRQRREHLGQLRAIDLDVLELFVNAAQEGKDLNHVMLDQYAKVRDELLEMSMALP